MTIYGTRPEAIKVAPVIKAIDEDPGLSGVPVVTGQHREMLDQVNTLFDIFPLHDLDIMSAGQSLNGVVAKVIRGIDEILEQVQPDAVIVQGDTSSVMGAAGRAHHRGTRMSGIDRASTSAEHGMRASRPRPSGATPSCPAGQATVVSASKVPMAPASRAAAGRRTVLAGSSSSSRCLTSAGTSSANCSRSEEHTSELQSRGHLVCRLLLEKKKNTPQH